MRENYDEIKKKFTTFMCAWSDPENTDLSQIITDDILCNLSVVKAYSDGAQHSRVGVESFLKHFPQKEFLYWRICNFVCRTSEDQAQQSAVVPCRALQTKQDEEVKFCEFTVLFANHWQKHSGSWWLQELRMDVVKHSGDLETIEEEWFFEEGKPGYRQGIHLPCIVGELDSPWARIKFSDTVLTEEEQIQEVVAKHNFGLDHLIFDYTADTLHEDFHTMNSNFGGMDKRFCINVEKYHRQSNRHWVHPYLLSNIEIRGDDATLDFYRMAGHSQRKQPYIFTLDNMHMEYACAKGSFRMIKQLGEWQIISMNYYLGIYELGEYELKLK
ncbi:hypothetical protein JZO81_05335 [Enterococcus hulanensis]|uniref:hypothetical protein n=1 Tax=Enterococcus TaxID=1350 RepID=UPI000B5A7A8B|nr:MULTISPECIES: hypothetical protein [Enterococcus]MBO0410466.1 hypothetical protein [Enterococcus hulanensis]OTO14357.1 hypothetical protein A5875_003514 [Enterococcus sp. 3H8_DIV0648]